MVISFFIHCLDFGLDVKVLSDYSTNKVLDRCLEKNFDEMRAGCQLTRKESGEAAPIPHLPKKR